MDPRDYKQNSELSIDIDGYGKLPFIDANPINFFKRTTILYGPSETGKTFVLKWIMNILKDLIPNVFVICPTAEDNEAYDGVVPQKAIRTKISVKFLKDLFDRQQASTRMYNRANRMPVLQSLFHKANDLSAINTANRIKKLCLLGIDRINKSQLNYAQKSEQIGAIEKRRDTEIIKLYKRTIETWTEQLRRLDLTEDERYTLKYLRFNPSLLLIMDDCLSQIKIWGKDPVVAKIFYDGRHKWITSVYTMQNDIGLLPGIRGNTFNNIFTDANVASRFFANKENAFTPEMKKKAQRIVEELFKENSNGADNHKKFVYSRLDKVAKFRYIIADKPKPFRFGNPTFWRFMDSFADENGDDENKLTKFSDSFNID